MFKSARRKIRKYKYNNPYSHRFLFLALEATMTFVEIALVIAVGFVGYKILINTMDGDQKLSARHTSDLQITQQINNNNATTGFEREA